MMDECTPMLWCGRKAFRLRSAGYEAILVPSLGANVISLKAVCGGTILDVLRTPPNDETLLKDPYAYGIPVLFPANRVAKGYYEWDGVKYQFPQNYPNGVHIHGVLHNREWPVEAYGAEAGRSYIRLSLDTEKDAELWSHFPVPMVIRLEVSVDADGLRHRFTVENHSREKEIPVGLAYHTAFRVSFCGSSQNVTLHVPLEGRCTDDPTDRLPNGMTAPLSAFERRIASAEGGYPLDEAVDALYTGVPGASDMVMRNRAGGCEVVYRAGPENHYWILWNQTASEDFIAVEPQTWLSNAMHFPRPQDQGAVIVSPGESWSGECRILTRLVKE